MCTRLPRRGFVPEDRCCPGMYNAITGIGGSGQLDSTVAANATVALFVAWAASSLTLVPPVFDVREWRNWEDPSDANFKTS